MERPTHLTLLPPVAPKPKDYSISPIDFKKEKERERVRIDNENTAAIYRRVLIHAFAHLPLYNATIMWRVVGALSIEEASERTGLSTQETQGIIDESNSILAESFPTHVRKVF